LRRSSGTLTARTLDLGMLGFDRFVQTPSGLAPRRLPAADQPQTFGVLAITLVPAPRLILLSAALAQADARAWSPRTGTTRAFWFNVTAACGSVISQRTARAERTTVLPGRFSQSKIRPTLASLPSPEGTTQGRKRLRKVGKKEPTSRPPLAGPPQTLKTGKEQDKEGNGLRKACKKETMKNTPAALGWLSSNAHNRRCFPARSHQTGIWSGCFRR
jgi:hypothetical protein